MRIHLSFRCFIRPNELVRQNSELKTWPKSQKLESRTLIHCNHNLTDAVSFQNVKKRW